MASPNFPEIDDPSWIAMIEIHRDLHLEHDVVFALDVSMSDIQEAQSPGTTRTEFDQNAWFIPAMILKADMSSDQILGTPVDEDRPNDDDDDDDDDDNDDDDDGSDDPPPDTSYGGK